MSNYFKMTLPALIFSSVIFYFIYKKVNIEKLISNKNSRKIGAIIITFILYAVGLEIIDSFNTTKVYHDLFMGLFLGPFISIMAFA